MVSFQDIITYLERLAPASLAEEWDNVGLLVGDTGAETSTVLTCLTLTPDVAAEAVQRGAGLVVTHHPLMFRPVQRITTETPQGQTLLELIAAGVAVYSPHTGYDSTAGGINEQIAELLELRDVIPLRPAESGADADERSAEQAVGAGRCGALPEPMPLGRFNGLVKGRLKIEHLQFVGEADASVERVAVACGSAAEFIPDAINHGCQALLTGEARFHAALEARSRGIALVLAGHYASERFAVERLAAMLAEAFPSLDVSASAVECDPIQWA